MLLDSSPFTEVNPTAQGSDLDYVQADVPDVAFTDVAFTMDELLDASSLSTVLAMLEVIDSAEELALLETLTLAQKRQVWDATPEQVRGRLKQLREAAARTATLATLNDSLTDSLTDSSLDEPEEDIWEETGADWESEAASEVASGLFLPERLPGYSSVEELDPTKLNPGTALHLQAGDWVILQAKPQFTPAELMAIWEVIEVQGDEVQVFTHKLGTHTYPMDWVVPYPKPIGYVEPEF